MSLTRIFSPLMICMCALLLVASALFVFGADAESDRNGIVNVRFGENEHVTRVVFDSLKPIEYVFYPVSGDEKRVIIAFEAVDWLIGNKRSFSGQGDAIGVVDRFRYSTQAGNNARIILDLNKAALPANVFSIPAQGRSDHHRLVFDFETVDASTFRQAAIDASQDFSEKWGSSPAQKDPARKVVVVDAGHGGKDPGALSPRSDLEKDITLKAALQLKERLEKSDRYQVVLTRDDDTYLTLEERVAIARNAGADLFISLHADSAPNREAFGASVYTLAEQAQARVDRVGAEENWIIPIETETYSPEVSSILKDLVKRETKTQSGEFAKILISEMAKSGPLVRNTHRKANFFVLLAPDVPAVLLELGFLSNSNDAKRLTSERGLSKAVSSIEEAIDTYFESQHIMIADRNG